MCVCQVVFNYAPSRLFPLLLQLHQTSILINLPPHTVPSSPQSLVCGVESFYLPPVKAPFSSCRL